MARLDDKLKTIAAGDYQPRDFIIADAKDGDMGFGAACPGPRRDGGGAYKTLADYTNQIRAIIDQDEVDIMLTSVSTYEVLKDAGAFDGSAVTPAVRLNDTSDIWTNRHGVYGQSPSRPFRTALLPEVTRIGVDLGLYSMTFTNDTENDVRTTEAFRAFREDLANHDLRWFLEVFNPNVSCGIDAADVGAFINDWIVRALAGMSNAERPKFLKIAYNGPAAMEELVAYDPRLVVGVLGGSAGTTHDTFQLLRQASKRGAKLALFGRKINLAESPLDIVALMRPVAAGDIAPADAVRAYHDALAKQDIAPARSLDDDLLVTEAVLQAEA